MRVLPLASAAWRFRDASRRSPWREALVPGCVHRDLLRHGLIPDPFHGLNEAAVQWVGEREWDYRASFTVPAAFLAEEEVDLVADGLDTVAAVALNGREVGRSENMFAGLRWGVRRHLRPGRNELSVRFASALDYIRTHRTGHQPRQFNDAGGRCTVIRKQQCQFGWDWAPRLVTAGIWRDIRLEAWSGNRLAGMHLTQHHAPAAGAGRPTAGRRRTASPGPVRLHLSPELARPGPGATCRWRLALGEVAVAEGTGFEVDVEHPQLWWPAGQGAQPLYRLEVEVIGADGAGIGRWTRRIGLRTLALDRHADAWGESFQFVVNGRPVFAKGANWIPAHAFVAGLTRRDYERDLRSAAAAHMNMLRVWGGGVYESEDFYDLCDELGLLVWQDFMFACTLYPGDAAFVESVRDEARFQVRRLRHRACLALWCGNNEVFGCNAQDLVKDPLRYAEYEAVFHQCIPSVVAALDPATPYWPGSPWRGDTDAGTAAGEARGDTHFWDVWHARRPVKDYESHFFRFASEFGMQSFPSAASLASFCPPGDTNVFGPAMSNHQKNLFGNQIILDYVSRRYPFPRDQDALLHLSQLNQAHCMQVAVEHYRRNQPRCMGALYWQLNDCWPVASWSSLEFDGRWKALHHAARRFFAPALASAHVPGDEEATIGNTRVSSIREVHLYTVYDAPVPARGRLRWDLLHFDGRVLLSGSKPVRLRPGESLRRKTLDLSAALARHGRDNVCLRIALDVAGGAGPALPGCAPADGWTRASEETVLLSPPRFLALPRPRTHVKVAMPSPTRARLTFTSPVFQHRLAFDLRGIAHRSSDNWFDLYPGEPKTVVVELTQPLTPARLRRLLTTRSLADNC